MTTGVTDQSHHNRHVMTYLFSRGSLESPYDLLVLLKERVKWISLHNVLEVLFIVLRNGHDLREVNLCRKETTESTLPEG